MIRNIKELQMYYFAEIMSLKYTIITGMQIRSGIPCDDYKIC